MRWLREQLRAARWTRDRMIAGYIIAFFIDL